MAYTGSRNLGCRTCMRAPRACWRHLRTSSSSTSSASRMHAPTGSPTRRSTSMARVNYKVVSDLDPKVVWDALTEFGPRRAELWPDLSPSSFEVLEQGPNWARVREGTASLGIWSIERYEWEYPVITATVEEANAAQTGGTWRMEVRPRSGGGCVLTISMNRR